MKTLVQLRLHEQSLLLLLLIAILVVVSSTSQDYDDSLDLYKSPSSISSSQQISKQQSNNLEQYLIKKINFNELRVARDAAVVSNFVPESLRKSTTSLPKVNNVNNLVLHNGSLYVGAQDWLLKFNAETLELEQSVQYGPILDSAYCRYYSSRGGGTSREECLSGGAKKQLVSNFNKVLIVYPRRQLLLSCWTGRQGVCDVRDLNNITELVHESTQATVGNDALNSTVGFIASSSNSQDLFYVANTYTNLGPYRDEVPALAGRSLATSASGRFMEVAQSRGQGLKSTQASIEFIARYRKSFVVKYVHGFNLGVFNYFLTVQHNDIDSNTNNNVLQTKLARFCLNDLSFVKSYTEMPLRCVSSKRNPTTNRPMYYYNELVSAKVLRLGTKQHYIVGLFQQTSRTTFNDSLDQTTPRQAVCLFSMRHVQSRIRENVRQCHQNRHDLMRGLSFIKPDQQCRTSNMFDRETPQNDQQQQRSDIDSDSDFCSLADNGLYPIGGQLAAQSIAVLEFESTDTKPMQFDTLQVAENGQEEDNDEDDTNSEQKSEAFDIILLSNKLQELHMFNIKSLNSIPVLYRTIRLNPSNSETEQDFIVKSAMTNLQLDRSWSRPNSLFLVSKNVLYKLRTSSCEQYKTCTECLISSNSIDPECGWCPTTNQCSTKGECRQAAVSGDKWLSSSQLVGDLNSVCVDINKIVPTAFSRRQLTSVAPFVEVNFGLNLVNSSSLYQCVFRDSQSAQVFKTDAELIGLQKLKCQLPDTNRLGFMFDASRNKQQNMVLADDGLFKVLASPSDQYYYEETPDRAELDFYIENKEIRYGTVPTASSDSLQTMNNITIFDCRAHKSCISCMSLASQYCKWCNNECVDATSASGDRCVSESSESCASFDTGTSRLLIPFTANRQQAPLQIRLANYVTSHSKLECLLTTFDGRVNASRSISLPYNSINQTHGLCILQNVFQLLDDWIVQNQGQIQTNLRLFHRDSSPDQSYFVDSITHGRLALLFYKCELKGGHDCNQCLNLNSQLSCMWCGNSPLLKGATTTASSQQASSCRFMNAKSKLASLSHCVAPFMFASKAASAHSSSIMLNQCERPHIALVEPRKLPITGGSRVVIKGVNIGSSLDDVIDINIKCGLDDVLTVPCDLSERDYLPGRQIVCRTRAVKNQIRRDCKLQVRLRLVGNSPSTGDEENDENTLTLSFDGIEYVMPMINVIEPSVVIQSARSAWLTLRGSDLDAGSTRVVEILDSVGGEPAYGLRNRENSRTIRCEIRNVTSQEIRCRLSESFRTMGKKHVQVMFDDDNAYAAVETQTLRVTNNPIVNSVDKRVTFYSGGTRFHLFGFNLATPQNAFAYVSSTSGWMSELSPAVNRISNEEMVFEFPGLSRTFLSSQHHRSHNHRHELQLGFLFDGFNVSLADSPRIVYIPDLTSRSLGIKHFEMLKLKKSVPGSSGLSLLVEFDADEATWQFLINENMLVDGNLQIFMGCSFVCRNVELVLNGKQQVTCVLPTNEQSNAVCDSRALAKIAADLNESNRLNLVNIFLGNVLLEPVNPKMDLIEANENLKIYLDTLNYTSLCMHLLRPAPRISNLHAIQHLIVKSNLTVLLDDSVIASLANPSGGSSWFNTTNMTLGNLTLIVSIVTIFLVVLILASIILVKTIFKINYQNSKSGSGKFLYGGSTSGVANLLLNYNTYGGASLRHTRSHCVIKKSEKEQKVEFEQIREQINALEMQVRPVCTQLYQQLHTDYLNDLNNDLIYKIYNLSYTNALPMWNFKTYLYNVFFHSTQSPLSYHNGKLSAVSTDAAGKYDSNNFMSSSSMSNSTTNTLLSSTLTPKQQQLQQQSVYATIKSSSGLKFDQMDTSTSTAPNTGTLMYQSTARHQELLMHGCIGEAMLLFDQLLNNKNFLLTFLQQIEKTNTMSGVEKRNFVGLLTLSLRHNLSYLYSILKLLLSEQIAHAFRTKTQRSLFKPCGGKIESMGEMLLTNWLSIFMYTFQRDTQCSIELFRLVQCIRYYLQMGPCDQCQNKAVNTINERSYLSGAGMTGSSCDSILVWPYQTLYVNLIVNGNTKALFTNVALNDCDSVPQAKEKCLDWVFKSNLNLSQFGVSCKPSLAECDLELCLVLIKNDTDNSLSTQQPQQTTTFVALKETEDELTSTVTGQRVDESSEKMMSGELTRLLTLKDYNIQSGSFLNISFKINPKSQENDEQANHVYMSTLSMSNEYVLYASNSCTQQPINSNNRKNALNIKPNDPNRYHLAKPEPGRSGCSSQTHFMSHSNKKQSNKHKKYEKTSTVKSQDSAATATVSLIQSSAGSSNNPHSSSASSSSSSGSPSPLPSSSENRTNILARLMVNKGTLQPFIDQFIETVFANTANLPPVIQHLFAFIDSEIDKNAKQHQSSSSNSKSSFMDESERESLGRLWKTQCYFVKYWLNMIRHPEFLLDVNTNPLIESNLESICAALFDSMSLLSSMPNGMFNLLYADSGSNSSRSAIINRLLFLNDIPKYKHLIDSFYTELKANSQHQPISDHELYFYLNEFSKMNNSQDIMQQGLDVCLNMQTGLNVNTNCQQTRTLDECGTPIQALTRLYEAYEKHENGINIDLGQQQCSILLPVHHRLVQIKELMNGGSNTNGTVQIVNTTSTLNRTGLLNGILSPAGQNSSEMCYNISNHHLSAPLVPPPPLPPTHHLTSMQSTSNKNSNNFF